MPLDGKARCYDFISGQLGAEVLIKKPRRCALGTKPGPLEEQCVLSAPDCLPRPSPQSQAWSPQAHLGEDLLSISCSCCQVLFLKVTDWRLELPGSVTIPSNTAACLLKKAKWEGSGKSATKAGIMVFCDLAWEWHVTTFAGICWLSESSHVYSEGGCYRESLKSGVPGESGCHKRMFLIIISNNICVLLIDSKAPFMSVVFIWCVLHFLCACMYVCICICVMCAACVCMYMYICMCVDVCFMCICVLQVWVCIYMYMYVWYMYMYTYMFVYGCVHICVWMCFVCVCVIYVACVYVHMCLWVILPVQFVQRKKGTLGCNSLSCFILFAWGRVSHWTWNLLIFFFGPVWQSANFSDPSVSPPHPQALESQAHTAMSDFYMALRSKLRSSCVHSRASHPLSSSPSYTHMLMHAATSWLPR